MRAFFIRFSIFIGLWLWMLYETSGDHSISILWMTASLLLLFFLSNQHAHLIVYDLLIVLLFIHGLWSQQMLYTYLLQLIILFTAIGRLKQKQLLSLYVLQLTSSIILFLPNRSEVIFITMLHCFIGYLMYKLHKMNIEKNTLVIDYEQVLGEYRQLKRMQLAAESTIKEAERRKIAREIHDSVGHRLTALIMKLEILRVEEGDGHYLMLKQMAEESLQETREAVQALTEDEPRGVSAVVQLIRKLEAENNLLITFTMKKGVLSCGLTNEQGIVLYRVIQEALTNVMRHSQTKQVEIIMEKTAIHELLFTVENVLHHHEKIIPGFGIANMNARMEEVGGRLETYQTTEMFHVRGIIPIGEAREAENIK